MKLNPNNWFWCDTCERSAYLFECGHGTTCSSESTCWHCNDIYLLVLEAKKEGTTPTREECIANNVKRWGHEETPEKRILDNLFGKQEGN